MQFRKLATLAGLGLLMACGGEKKTTTDSAATASTPTPANASASTTSSSSGGSPAPITGQTVEIKMLQDAQGNYHFEPADVTIKPGDGVKFIMVSGGPHNVAFDPAQIPPAAKAQLSATMPNKGPA